MELTSNEFELESLTGFLTQTLFHLLNNLTLLLQNYFLKKFEKYKKTPGSNFKNARVRGTGVGRPTT